MEYNVKLNRIQEMLLRSMLNDSNFWPGSAPPQSLHQLISWAVEDYIDYYLSYKGSKL